jgi:hypothetical protein
VLLISASNSISAFKSLWFEESGFSMSPEITRITGINDEMVAGHRARDAATEKKNVPRARSLLLVLAQR